VVREEPGDSSRVVEFALFPASEPSGDGLSADSLSAPICDPLKRNLASVAPPSSYRPGDPVWVHRSGAWRPGVVEAASGRAVMATYRFADGQGTIVDTMSAEYVIPRTHLDAQLDRSTLAPGVAA
jgi:hypothetical protein